MARRTAEWLRRFCVTHSTPRVRFGVIDNPKQIVSAGLNQCIEHSKGEVIVRMDVHTVYTPDYIAECLAALAETGADNVGGPWKAEGTGLMQRAVAAAFQSSWVAGGARSRQLDYNGWVDTVYLGCWPVQTFRRFGGFDEKLVRNQDDEHNLRIRRGGGNVWQSARIRSAYRPRARLGDVFRQWRQYGYWKPFVMLKHGQAASVRHLVPALFIAALVVSGALALSWPALWVLPAGVLLFYLGYLGFACVDVWQNLQREGQPRAAAVLTCVPAVVLAYHFGYGLGSWRGWFDALIRGRADPAFGRLTR